MKTVVYKAKGELSGTVTVEIPSQKQRMEMLKECNFHMENGELDGIANLDGMLKMYEHLPKFIKKVCVKNTEGIEVKSFDKLANDSDYDTVCNDLIIIIIGGGLGES